MAKNNLDHYGHETDSHNHWKFKVLRKSFGWAGEGKFWALNNMIACADFCMLDLSNEEKKIAIAIELDLTVGEFEDFLDFLERKCKLIQRDKDTIFTEKTQICLELLNEKRQRQKKWRDSKMDEKRQLGDVEKPERDVENEKRDVSNEKKDVENTQRKVKESKGKIKESKYSDDGDAASPPKKNLEEKQNEMVLRQKDFYKTLVAFVDRYGKEMIRAFFDYWSEPNRGKTKFRMEYETTWDLQKRLTTWDNNQYKFNGKSKKENDQPSIVNAQLKAAKQQQAQ